VIVVKPMGFATSIAQKKRAISDHLAALARSGYITGYMEGVDGQQIAEAGHQELPVASP
jgi:hypothetical protein